MAPLRTGSGMPEIRQPRKAQVDATGRRLASGENHLLAGGDGAPRAGRRTRSIDRYVRPLHPAAGGTHSGSDRAQVRGDDRDLRRVRPRGEPPRGSARGCPAPRRRVVRHPRSQQRAFPDRARRRRQAGGHRRADQYARDRRRSHPGAADVGSAARHLRGLRRDGARRRGREPPGGVPGRRRPRDRAAARRAAARRPPSRHRRRARDSGRPRTGRVPLHLHLGDDRLPEAGDRPAPALHDGRDRALPAPRHRGGRDHLRPSAPLPRREPLRRLRAGVPLGWGIRLAAPVLGGRLPRRRPAARGGRVRVRRRAVPLPAPPASHGARPRSSPARRGGCGAAAGHLDRLPGALRDRPHRRDVRRHRRQRRAPEPRRPGGLRRKAPCHARGQVGLARFAHAAGEIARGADGFAIACDDDEAGELLGKVGTEGAMEYDGYTDRAATERKLLRNVFAPGDAWFRTGDLLRRDAEGYYYFVDRIGDTFRWKGENVATQEVADVLNGAPGITETTVYGVTIPGEDGRAGMAALVLERDATFDDAAFYAHAERHLPRYAMPAAVRIVQAVDVTGTLKQRKARFVEDGFVDASISDPVLVRDDAARRYVPFTPALRQDLREGRLRL